MKQLILDIDSSVSPTHRDQEGTAYNGHFGCDCYNPLFVFNQDGNVERALLRKGNVSSADDWRAVLGPVINRYEELDVSRLFVVTPRSPSSNSTSCSKQRATATPSA